MITYCTNLHPGDDWPTHFAELQRWLPAVKARVSSEQAFPVGLRLSALAAQQLAQRPALAEFRAFVAAEGLFVPTINGFPYGDFHVTRVKEQAYVPDWRQPERLAYTRTLADLLGHLLPAGMVGSISTVPGAYAAHLRGRHDVAQIVANLVRAAAHLHGLRAQWGQEIVLALEPEPGCLIETVDETCCFFRDDLFAPSATTQMASLTGLPRLEAEAALRRHLGVCLDACHLAVSFDSPQRALSRLSAEGIRIAKLQVSSGLALPSPDAEARAALDRLADPVWLHQVRVRHRTGIRAYADLPDALRSDFAAHCEWRVHLHVPVWAERFGPFATTSAELRQLLRLQALIPFTDLLEVETYSWELLPAAWRGIDPAASIAKEIEWTRENLGSSATAA